MVPTDLAKFLKMKREEAGFTKIEVATTLGYSSPQFITNWENGRAYPPIHIIARVSHMYNVDPDEMFGAILKQEIENVTNELQKALYL